MLIALGSKVLLYINNINSNTDHTVAQKTVPMFGYFAKSDAV